jgi:hypothetical protein
MNDFSGPVFAKEAGLFFFKSEIEKQKVKSNDAALRRLIYAYF